MNGVELRYPSAWRVLRERVVEDLPDVINAQNAPDHTIDFTPKFYNTSDATMQTNRKMLYPNKQPVPSTIDPTSGLITFHLTFSTANGFTNNTPARVAYQFTGFAGDQKKAVLVDIPKVITVANVSTGFHEAQIPVFQVWPSPAVSELHIPQLSADPVVQTRITGITGQEFRSVIVSPQSGISVLSVSHLPAGIYTLTLHTAQGRLIGVSKFVKANTSD